MPYLPLPPPLAATAEEAAKLAHLPEELVLVVVVALVVSLARPTPGATCLTHFLAATVAPSMMAKKLPRRAALR